MSFDQSIFLILIVQLCISFEELQFVRTCCAINDSEGFKASTEPPAK